MTEQIARLVQIAREDNDPVGERFLGWFLDEQREEVASMSALLAVIDRAGTDNMLLVEDYLARGSVTARRAVRSGTTGGRRRPLNRSRYDQRHAAPHERRDPDARARTAARRPDDPGDDPAGTVDQHRQPEALPGSSRGLARGSRVRSTGVNPSASSSPEFTAPHRVPLLADARSELSQRLGRICVVSTACVEWEVLRANARKLGCRRGHARDPWKSRPFSERRDASAAGRG